MVKKCDCFAYKYRKCTALRVSKCEGESCSFYKSKLYYKIDRENAVKRIQSLPEKIKRKISDKYFDGKKIK
jgi:hypothetical protein